MARGLRCVSLSFGARTLTSFGSVYLLHLFISRLGLKDAMATGVRVPQRNNRYSAGEMILVLIYPMILGFERLETTLLLTRNGVYEYLTGLPAYPNATTVRRILLRLDPAALPKLRRLHHRFRTKIVAHDEQRRFIFDVDSTVVVVYGYQEQARRGYNPGKRGRLSYLRMVCFEGLSHDYWAGELRPGDAHTAQGALELLDACIAKLPRRPGGWTSEETRGSTTSTSPIGGRDAIAS